MREFGSVDKSYYVPYQITVFKVYDEDMRFIERPPLPLKEEFPIGCRGFFLSLKVYASLVQIQGYNEAETGLNCKIIVISQSKKII